jgi:hypothetical protein
MAKVKFAPPPATAEELTALEEDFRGARACGPVWLGEHYLFYHTALRIRYLALTEINRAYLRREQTLVTTGCRRTLSPLPFLVAVLTNGEQRKISFGDDDAPVWELLEALPKKNPDIVIGYEESNAKCSTCVAFSRK